MKVDFVIHNAGQFVTCASEGKPKRGERMRDVGLIENGAAAIKDGIIAGIGTSEEIFRRFEAENAIDARGRVVCPAFVDPHTHIVFAGERINEFELKIKGADYLEIMAAGGGIVNTAKKTRAASLKDLMEQSTARLDKMLAHGTATAEIKTGYGLDTETELKMLDAILRLDRAHPMDLISTFLPAHAVPPEFAGKADEYVNLICEEMLPRALELFRLHKINWDIKEDMEPKPGAHVMFGLREITEADIRALFENNPIFVDVFCEKNAFNLEQSRRVLETAKSLGFRLKAHVDEFTNLGCARLAIELGATSIDHLDATSDEEIRLLAESETVGVVTPTVNFNFGSTRYADARKMIDAGCAVALSTDYNPGSAPCPSQPMAMAIACRYQKILPSEALNAVTINSAFAIGLGEKTGSLETGKQADLLILNTRDYREIAYEFGSNFVETVFKNGKVVYS
ncbi:MAG: amidohydrolase family protein [Acidobacteriota bacterium]|nr:amidohydrolase family protein [Acidobacteriota bacterium]